MQRRFQLALYNSINKDNDYPNDAYHRYLSEHSLQDNRATSIRFQQAFDNAKKAYGLDALSTNLRLTPYPLKFFEEFYAEIDDIMDEIPLAIPDSANMTSLTIALQKALNNIK